MTPTNQDIVTDILRREGGGAVTNDPLDKGGRTQYGISELSNAKAWLDGKITEAEARLIYEKRYIIGPGFDQVVDFKLRSQLVDYGVNSGPVVAIKKLQELLPPLKVDGVLGPKTLAVINTLNPTLVGNQLACARAKMIVRIVQNSPSQLKFAYGWISRTLEFIV